MHRKVTSAQPAPPLAQRHTLYMLAICRRNLSSVEGYRVQTGGDFAISYREGPPEKKSIAIANPQKSPRIRPRQPHSRSILVSQLVPHTTTTTQSKQNPDARKTRRGVVIHQGKATQGNEEPDRCASFLRLADQFSSAVGEGEKKRSIVF
jgi:hypothetical protein